ncbi:MAG: hypothetical protein LN417_07940 [Candidatus Thermoplasmatota archaeon]|nr:hypothetical protein [Candidatus Thermoplasmatota archaeon]
MLIDTTYTAALLADEEVKRLAVAIDDEKNGCTLSSIGIAGLLHNKLIG